MTTKPLALLLVKHALNNAELLPSAERADLYEAAAECLRNVMPEEATAASETAKALREASALQLTFKSLLLSAAG